MLTSNSKEKEPKRLKIINYIIGAIALCIILLLLKNELTPLLMRNATYGMSALIKKGEVKELYIGSSMFKQGLDDEVLKEKYGDDWYVLTYNGNQPVMEAFELEYLLSKGVKIDDLYIDMYAYTAYSAPKLSDESILLDIPLKKKFELYDLLYGKADTDNKIKTAWRMFVAANNDEILTWPVTSSIINSQFDQGASMVHTDGNNKAVLDKTKIPPADDIMDASQAEAIKKIVDLSEQNNINVFFVETPKYILLQNDPVYTKMMDEYRAYLDEVLPGCVIFQEGVDNTDENMFMDIFHLSSEGRKVFTGKLTEMIGSTK